MDGERKDVGINLISVREKELSVSLVDRERVCVIVGEEGECFCGVEREGKLDEIDGGVGGSGLVDERSADRLKMGWTEKEEGDVENVLTQQSV